MMSSARQVSSLKPNQLVGRLLVADVPRSKMEVKLLCGWLHVDLRSSIVQCVLSEKI